MTDLNQMAGKVVGDVAQSAMNQGTSFLGGLIRAPFNAVVGLGKGVFGSLMNSVMIGAGIAGSYLLLPDLWHGITKTLGGQKLADKAASVIKEDGLPGVLKMSALGGLLVGGTYGGLTGMIDEVSGSAKSGEDGAKSEGIGTFIGGAVAIAAVSAVAIGAFTRKPEAGPDAPPKTPANPPAPKGPVRT